MRDEEEITERLRKKVQSWEMHLAHEQQALRDQEYRVRNAEQGLEQARRDLAERLAVRS